MSQTMHLKISDCCTLDIISSYFSAYSRSFKETAWSSSSDIQAGKSKGKGVGKAPKGTGMEMVRTLEAYSNGLSSISRSIYRFWFDQWSQGMIGQSQISTERSGWWFPYFLVYVIYFSYPPHEGEVLFASGMSMTRIGSTRERERDQGNCDIQWPGKVTKLRFKMDH